MKQFSKLGPKKKRQICLTTSVSQRGVFSWSAVVLKVAFWVMDENMAAEWKEKVLDLFTCENGSFSLHEIMDRLEIKSNAIVNVAIFELVREGVLTQTSEMPPKWEFTRAQSETETEKNCVGERSDEGKLFVVSYRLKSTPNDTEKEAQQF